MKNYYGIDFDKQKEKLLRSDKAKNIINSVIEKADDALVKTYEALKMSDYMLFTKTGDRKTFEKKYFERRNDCSYVSIAYWLTDDKKYINQLIDLIFHICDEYTWCVPAHASLHENPPCEHIVEMVDLFQAETGRLLADIAFLVGNKLPYYVNKRIEYEIKRRIIEPLKNKQFSWQKAPMCKTNWAAVCAGGTATALLGFGTEEDINTVLPILYLAIDDFLSGFNDDGCCMEGCTYWNYGFGYFVIFARLILEYTNGEINYFEQEKVKNIATFIQKIRLGKTKIVSFSDSTSEFSFSPGLFSYLKQLYPDDIVLPPLELGTARGNIYSMKELLWFDTDYSEGVYKSGTVYFENAQWYIKKNDAFSFAAKAGNNKEPHNHNDVGSFMIVTKDGEIPLTDFGAAIYTKETFERDNRYKLINNSSRGHSVPIINGQYQGAEDVRFSAKNVKAGEDFFEADIEDAYEKDLIGRINRRFEVKEESVFLCDTFEFSNITEKITERFVSWTKPVIYDEYVDLKTARILYNKEKYTVKITEDSYRTHSNIEDKVVYLIDFEAINKKEPKFEVEISVE